ncbi:MAG TPA: tubulin-like doman-containing protein, partial [Armatimonadota bacterium]|nr:tubulin-like doman-containing protein [Armatimonadota bacterium]
MPDLILGVGGAGAEVCRRLAERLDEASPDALLAAAAGQRPEIMQLDTDRSTDPDVTLTATAAVLDAAYRAPERFAAEWIQPEVLRGRGSVEEGTAGSRMLGRFLLLLPENREAVEERVARWLRADGEDPRRIWVVASLAGGTGSGSIVDLGYLLRRAAADTGVEAEVRAILFVPPAAEDAASANALAALTELHYFSDPATRYEARLDGSEAPYHTREAPYHRVALLTSTAVGGSLVPLPELQERASVYLLTACTGDDGSWRRERAEQEARVAGLDADGNPQPFTTFGIEWVEYPEERLARGVYRNLVRRSLLGWLQGDRPVPKAEVSRVPLRDSTALAKRLTDWEGQVEALLRPIRTRLPWIHKAPQQQWIVMDQEFETGVREAAGTGPAPGQPAKGPFVDRARSLREQAVGDFRGQARDWLSREQLHIDRVARALADLTAELTTFTDPAGNWESAREVARQAKHRILWSAAAARKDPFLFPYRRAALRKLAEEYERIAGRYAFHLLEAQAIPFMRELRAQVLEPLRAWAARTNELGAWFAEQSRAWAAEESALLERLRQEQEDGRLALGLIRLPGRETPFVANSGWELAYATPQEEGEAIRHLRQGWLAGLVEREDGLLAPVGRSALDGGPEQFRAFVQALEGDLRASARDRLGGWLSATAFQRMAEGHRDPVELEFHLRRIVAGAADLPALEPVHARPADLAPEYELLLFGSAKAEELPAAVRVVVEEASRQRPVRVAPSRSEQYLAAVTEHPGFALSRCPAYFHLAQSGVLPSYSRNDVPWTSATLV